MMRNLLDRKVATGAGVAVVLAFGLNLALCTAQEVRTLFRHDPNKADTSRAARDSAVRAIPTDKLSADAQAKVSWVLSNASIFRRLPIRMVQCDPDLYLFLVHHPDVVVNIWEVLGVSHLTMERSGPDTFKVVDEIGTSGSLQFLYRSRDTNVAYIDGTYTGSMFSQQVHARGLMILKSGYVRETDGRVYVTSRLDAFLTIEPGGMEFLTKTFQPVVGKIADGNFLQTAGFLGSISRTAEVNNPGVQRLAEKLNRVSPDVRQEFARLANQVAQRTGQSSGANTVSQRTESAADDEDAPKIARRTQEATPAPLNPLRTSSTPNP